MNYRAEKVAEENIKAARAKMEEFNDQSVQAVIIDKRTGEIVDRHNDLRHDNAKEWAQKQIFRHAHLKYQIISVT